VGRVCFGTGRDRIGRSGPRRVGGEGGSARCVVARMPAPAPRKRLSDDGRKAVLRLLAEDLAAGRVMSAKIFTSEYCVPAKHAENWAQTLRGKFGKLGELPACERVLKYLRSASARLEILACMRANAKLDGAAQPSIEQCRALVAELQHLQDSSTGPSGIRPW
jgi:hypothetical protein